MLGGTLLDARKAGVVRRILVLEDELLISLLLKDWLSELGCETLGPVASLSGAVELVETERPDAAILDLMIGKEWSYPVAEALRGRAVPFAFATGHGAGDIQPAYADVPVLAKPFEFSAVRRMLAVLISPARQTRTQA